MAKKRQNREVNLPVLRSDAARIGAEEFLWPADRDSEPVRHFHGGFELIGRLADEMRDPDGGDGVDWSVLDSIM